ncbi:unnamed protein product [Amoebophrya sp. A120]|nr:unnamed protein product [Amoebophrya sp. A120]|eukprot:GSA120T00020758001.1
MIPLARLFWLLEGERDADKRNKFHIKAFQIWSSKNTLKKPTHDNPNRVAPLAQGNTNTGGNVYSSCAGTTALSQQQDQQLSCYVLSPKMKWLCEKIVLSTKTTSKQLQQQGIDVEESEDLLDDVVASDNSQVLATTTRTSQEVLSSSSSSSTVVHVEAGSTTTAGRGAISCDPATSTTTVVSGTTSEICTTTTVITSHTTTNKTLYSVKKTPGPIYSAGGASFLEPGETFVNGEVENVRVVPRVGKRGTTGGAGGGEKCWNRRDHDDSTMAHDTRREGDQEVFDHDTTQSCSNKIDHVEVFWNDRRKPRCLTIDPLDGPVTILTKPPICCSDTTGGAKMNDEKFISSSSAGGAGAVVKMNTDDGRSTTASTSSTSSFYVDGLVNAAAASVNLIPPCDEGASYMTEHNYGTTTVTRTTGSFAASQNLLNQQQYNNSKNSNQENDFQLHRNAARHCKTAFNNGGVAASASGDGAVVPSSQRETEDDVGGATNLKNNNKILESHSTRMIEFHCSHSISNGSLKIGVLVRETNPATNQSFWAEKTTMATAGARRRTRRNAKFVAKLKGEGYAVGSDNEGDFQHDPEFAEEDAVDDAKVDVEDQDYNYLQHGGARSSNMSTAVRPRGGGGQQTYTSRGGPRTSTSANRGSTFYQQPQAGHRGNKNYNRMSSTREVEHRGEGSAVEYDPRQGAARGPQNSNPRGQQQYRMNGAGPEAPPLRAAGGSTFQQNQQRDAQLQHPGGTSSSLFNRNKQHTTATSISSGNSYNYSSHHEINYRGSNNAGGMSSASNGRFY